MKLFVLLAFFGARIVHAQEQPAKTLLVEVQGITNYKGHNLYVALYRQQDSFPDFNRYFVNKVLAVKSATVVVEFQVPAGLYAVALCHDLNDNQQLDKNIFGYPKEPFGFSNNRKPKLSPPDFRECQFTFVSDNQKVSINIIE